MAIYPELLAGYQAAVAALTKLRIEVKDPRFPTTFPIEPVQMLAAGPRAYTVYAFVRRDSIYLERTGRFGFDEENQVVEFPVPHTDPEFAARLAAVLVPAAEAMLARAVDQSTTERAALAPGEPVEAWEAVTEVTE